ncbi:MAG: PAS domain S-box protein [Candidatus Brocadiia bacterium]
MESLPGAAWLKDAEGRVVYASSDHPHHAKLGELAGRRPEEYLPESRAKAVREDDRRALEEGPLQTREILPAEGAEVSLPVRKFALLDNDEPYICCLALNGGEAQAVRTGPEERAAQERYRAIFENSGTAMVISEEDATISLVNQRLVEMTGYSRDELEGQMPWTDLVHEDDVDQAVTYHRARRQDPDSAPRTWPLRYRRKDGQVRNALVTVALLPGARRTVASLVDVTERQQAADQLEASEETFRSISEYSPFPIAISGEGGRVEYVNPRFTEVFGYTIEDIPTAEAWFSKAYPDPAERTELFREWQDDVHRMSPDGFMSRTLRIRCKDDSERVAVCHALRLPDGRIYTTFEDVTEQKEKEEELRRSRRRLELITRASREVFWIATPGLEEILYVSPAYEDLFGRPVETLYEDPTSFVESVHPDDRERVRAAIDDHPQGGWDFECRVRTPDGEVRWIHDRGYPVRDENGEVSLLTGIASDVTSRKATERRIQHRLRMEKAVADVSRLLLTSRELDAQEVCEVLGEAVGANRAYIFEMNDDGQTMDNTVEWCDENTLPEIDNLQGLPIEDFPWWLGKLRRGENILIRDIEKIPAEAEATREILQGQGIKALLSVPIHTVGGELAGFIGFDDTEGSRQWAPEDGQALRVVAEMLASDRERRRTRATLHKERAVLQAILRQMPAGVVVVDAESKDATFTSEAAERILQRPLTGANYREISRLLKIYYPDGRPYPPQDRPLARAIQGGAVVTDEELDLQLPDGSFATLLVSTAPVHDAEGEIVAGVLTFTEITERKRMEEALRRSRRQLEKRVQERTTELAQANEALQQEVAERKRAEQDLRLFANQWQTTFDALTDAVCLLAMDGTIVRANEAMAELTGVPIPKIIGKKCYKLMGCDWDNPEECPLARTRESKEREDVLRRQGDRWYVVSTDPFVNAAGRVDGVAHTVRDVTDMKRVEQELRESNALLEKIFDTTQMLIAYMDTNFDFIRVNRAYAEADGRAPEFFPGQSHFELYPNPENERIFGRVIETGAAYHVTEKPFVYEDSPERGVTYWDWSLFPVKDNRGKVEGLLLCLLDVTSRREAREKIQAYQEQLRHMASELSMIEQRERRRIASALHDQIGQTLALSKIKLGSLRQSLDERPEAEELEYVRQLIDDSISYTRSLVFELSPPILFELGLGPALEKLSRRIGDQYDLEVRFEDDGREKPLSPDLRVLLFQAAREVLVNVVKHAEATSATVSVERDDQKVRVTVEDDGIGFEASDPLQHARTEGGFGLFSIHERLDHLGGRLQISSTPGQGTSVTLVSPLHMDAVGDGEAG